jgi:hypothetical protein
MNQVQGTAGIGAKAYDVAGIRGNLRLVQYDVKHLSTLSGVLTDD